MRSYCNVCAIPTNLMEIVFHAQSRFRRGTRRAEKLMCRSLFSPQLVGRDAGTFCHGFELCPGDLRVADPRPEAAVGSCHDVFPADDLGVTNQPVGNRLRMLDDVGGGA